MTREELLELLVTAATIGHDWTPEAGRSTRGDLAEVIERRMREQLPAVTDVAATPMRARDIKPHDHVVGAGTVRWLFSTMVPGAHALVPFGGALLDFTNDTQMGILGDVELMVYRLATSDEDPCPSRDDSGIGCVYRAGHDESIFPHRYS